MLTDSATLRHFVVLPAVSISCECKSISVTEPEVTSGTNFIHDLLDEDSRQDLFDDEVAAFLREIAIAEKHTDPF